MPCVANGKRALSYVGDRVVSVVEDKVHPVHHAFCGPAGTVGWRVINIGMVLVLVKEEKPGGSGVQER